MPTSMAEGLRATAADQLARDSRSAREPKTGGMRVQLAVTPSPRPAPPLAEESSLNPRWSGGHVKITSYPSRVMWHAGKRIGRGGADACARSHLREQDWVNRESDGSTGPPARPLIAPRTGRLLEQLGGQRPAAESTR